MQIPAGEVTSVDVPPSVVEAQATTEAVVHDEHPTSLGLDAEGWVYVGVTIFILLAIFVFKAPKLIAGALDARIADVKAQLAEAKALRSEAETLLAEAREREAQGAKDAAAIITHASQEAGQIVTAAKAAAEAMIVRRSDMAEAKIAAAELAAEADLRARAANLATTAAASVIAASSDKDLQKKLTEAAISELERRLH